MAKDTMRWRKKVSIAAVLFPALVLTGCERAPSIDVLGSFFPAWIFCILAAIALTVASRLLLIRARLDGELGPGAVIYPCMAAFFAFSLWLIFFRF